MDLEIGNTIELVSGAALITRTVVERLCREAREKSCRAVLVPSGAIVLAQHFLEDGSIKICCEIGGPSGSVDPDAKRYETELAIDNGANEIELVPSLGKLQDGDYKSVLREIRDIAEAADERPVRVALEPMLWAAGELTEIVQLVLDSGAQFLCTSQDNEDDVMDELRRLRAICGPDFGIVARLDNEKEAVAAAAAGANLISLRI